MWGRDQQVQWGLYMIEAALSLRRRRKGAAADGGGNQKKKNQQQQKNNVSPFFLPSSKPFRLEHRQCRRERRRCGHVRGIKVEDVRVGADLENEQHGSRVFFLSQS